MRRWKESSAQPIQPQNGTNMIVNYPEQNLTSRAFRDASRRCFLINSTGTVGKASN